MERSLGALRQPRDDRRFRVALALRTAKRLQKKMAADTDALQIMREAATERETELQKAA
jgi:hypothetical protein